MRICVYGAGATGGHLAVRLALAGHRVSVVARGANLDAIRRDGMKLRIGDEELTMHVAASEDAADLGPQDMVVVATKATGLGQVAAGLAPLLTADTWVVFPQNGIPWWYPVGLDERRPAPPRLAHFALSVEFLGILQPRQIYGGVIYSANEMVAPGVVANESPRHNRIDIGAITARVGSSDLGALRKAFAQASISSPEIGDIRTAVWLKLLANISGSLIALATSELSSVARKDKALADIYRRLVREGLTIAAAHGFALADTVDPEAMLNATLDRKPSILQDYEQGRPMEILEIVEAPLAFAAAAGVDAPVLQTIGAIVARMAANRGLYASAPPA